MFVFYAHCSHWYSGRGWKSSIIYRFSYSQQTRRNEVTRTLRVLNSHTFTNRRERGDWETHTDRGASREIISSNSLQIIGMKNPFLHSVLLHSVLSTLTVLRDYYEWRVRFFIRRILFRNCSSPAVPLHNHSLSSAIRNSRFYVLPSVRLLGEFS